MSQVTIDNNQINGMRNEKRWSDAFPFVLNGSVKRGCCRSPGTFVPDYEGIKLAFTTMPDDKKALLKEMLSAEKVTVFVNRTGAPEEVTIA